MEDKTLTTPTSEVTRLNPEDVGTRTKAVIDAGDSETGIFTTKNIIIGVVGVAVLYFGLKHFKLIKF